MWKHNVKKRDKLRAVETTATFAALCLSTRWGFTRSGCRGRQKHPGPQHTTLDRLFTETNKQMNFKNVSSLYLKFCSEQHLND